MFQPQPGSAILGRYVLERELARGGMSSVWGARDHKLQRQVAVKLMAPTWSWSPDLRQRFEREAMAVAQLQSPHVVQVFDYGVEHDCPVIVMELLGGEDLRKRLKRELRLPLATVARIVAQAAKGISEAHGAGIIHRDLKPGNVFFARSRHDETVKVLDFGVAKADPASDFGNQATNSGAILGTPQYMSPEQARAKDTVDYRTDLWSLGVIIYQSLTGQLPYKGESATDTLVKICTEPFVPPTQLAPELPADIDYFIARALARDPNHRFSTAHEMAQALARIAPIGSASLHPPGQDWDEEGIVDEPTTVYDATAGSGPQTGPGTMPSVPSIPSFPSTPSMGSGSLGSQYMEVGRPPPKPGKQLALAVLASLLFAGVGVAATVHYSTQPPPPPSAAGVGTRAERPTESSSDDDADESDEPVETAAPAASSSAPDAAQTSAPVAKRGQPAPRSTSTSNGSTVGGGTGKALVGQDDPDTSTPPADAPTPDPYGSRF